MSGDPQKLKPQWFQILLSLADEDLHGSAIMEEVLERTDGRMKLWPGTLYGSLHDLAEEGLIRETDPSEDASPEGGNPRFYAITPEGRSALRAEVERMADVIRVARSKNVIDDLEPV